MADSSGDGRNAWSDALSARPMHENCCARPLFVQFSERACLSSCCELPVGGTGARGSGCPRVRSAQQRSTNGTMSGAASNAYTCHGSVGGGADGTCANSRSELHQFAQVDA